MFAWIVTDSESGDKLLSFVSQRLEGKYSLRSLKRAIENNRCQINGRTERFAATLVGIGDRITLDLRQMPPSVIMQVEEKRVIYEDEALLIYDKPSGVNCDENGIVRLLRQKEPSLVLVHRLDRDTTGILLLAKSFDVFENLVNQFKQFQVQKRYLAIIDGHIKQQRGAVENFLEKKHTYSGQTIWGAVKSSKGLKAITEWECIKRGRQASLVACYPKTGRTHQIRVHMAEIGHPILGDFQYGKEFQCQYRPERMLLHAEDIRFQHPHSGKLLQFTAPEPDDFKEAQRELFKGQNI